MSDRITTLSRKFNKVRFSPEDGLDVLKVLAVYATAISHPTSRQAPALLELLQEERESNEQDHLKVHRLIARAFNRVLSRELDGTTKKPHEHSSWLPAEVIYSIGNHWRLKARLVDDVKVTLQEYSQYWELSFMASFSPRTHARMIHHAAEVTEMLREINEATWSIYIPPFPGEYELGELAPETLWSIFSVRQSLEYRRELDTQLLKKLNEDMEKG